MVVLHEIDVQIGNVLRKCQGNYYLQQIFSNCADEQLADLNNKLSINK